MAPEESRAATSRVFSAYGRTLDVVPSFKYLGIVLSASNDDWPLVVRNLTKAWAFWRIMPRILSREGSRPLVSGFFFKAIVQLVLLFGAETWVVTPCMVRILGGFQDQVEQRLTGRLPRRRLDVRW